MHNAQQKPQTAHCRGFSWGVNKPAMQLISDTNNFIKFMLKAMLERNLCSQSICLLEHEANTCMTVSITVFAVSEKRLSLKSLNGSK